MNVQETQSDQKADRKLYTFLHLKLANNVNRDEHASNVSRGPNC
jgi:hypothetical protein